MNIVSTPVNSRLFVFIDESYAGEICGFILISIQRYYHNFDLNFLHKSRGSIPYMLTSRYLSLLNHVCSHSPGLDFSIVPLSHTNQSIYRN